MSKTGWWKIIGGALLAYMLAVSLRIPLSCKHQMSAKVDLVGEEFINDELAYSQNVSALLLTIDGELAGVDQYSYVIFDGGYCLRKAQEGDLPSNWGGNIENVSIRVGSERPQLTHSSIVNLSCFKALGKNPYKPGIIWDCEWMCY